MTRAEALLVQHFKVETRIIRIQERADDPSMDVIGYVQLEA
jgi:hypothetical protein